MASVAFCAPVLPPETGASTKSNALPGVARGQSARGGGGNGGKVEVQAARREALRQTLRAEGECLDIRAAGDIGAYDVGLARHLGRRCAATGSKR